MMYLKSMERETAELSELDDILGRGDARRVRRRVVSTSLYGGFVYTLCLFCLIIFTFSGEMEWEWEALVAVSVFLAAPTSVVVAIAAWLCIRRQRTKDKAGAASMVAGLVGGPAAVGLVSLMLGALILIIELFNPYSHYGDYFDGVGFWLLLTLMGAIFGGLPLGLISSLFFSPLVTLGAAHPRAVDRLEQTNRLCGGWMTLLGLVVGLCGALFEMGRSDGSGVVLFGLGAATAAFGSLLWVLGQRSWLQRMRWLERVRDGREPLWELRTLENVPIELIDTLPPVFHRHSPRLDSRELMGVLFRRATDAEGGAYRSGDEFSPVAVVSPGPPPISPLYMN